jgi:glycerol-3-phosphate dehydrogenase
MDRSIFNPDWNFKNRASYLDRLKTENFDLIVIGGGITGAGIAREAVLRSIKTALLDKNDFAFGTSSRSSKLVHGGLRYLTQGDFRLVRESTTERNWLRINFPNLIRPLPFFLCSYEKGKISRGLVRIAVRLYDFLSNFMSRYKNYKKWEILTPEEIIIEEPAIKKTGLLSAGKYYDTNVDDARLTLETIKESIAIGDVTAVNYAKVDDYIVQTGQIQGVKVTDTLTGEKFEIRGVHIVIKRERLGNKNALALTSIDDGRVFFVLPRGEFTLIGTTDTDYTGNLDDPHCSKEDCDYLFNTVNKIFPNAHLNYDDIISTYAGLRPLVIEKDAKNESAISRKHIIIDTEDGLITITGGKLTTFRKMGEDLIFHLIRNKIFDQPFSKKMLKKNYSKIPYLIGMERYEWDEFLKDNNPDLPGDILDLLYQQYGKGAMEIIKNVLKNPELSERFLPEHQFIPAEINYILKYEFAPHLIDVMLRRTEIAIKVHHSKQRIIAKKIADIMGDTYRWDETAKNAEIEKYMDYIAKTIWF